MSKTRSVPALCVAAVALALAAGGCGSSDSSGTTGGGGLYGSDSGARAAKRRPRPALKRPAPR